MKLSYDELSEKIGALWRIHEDMTTWQNVLTKLIEESGWTRDEFEQAVYLNNT